MKKPLSPRARKTLRVMKYAHIALFAGVVLVPMGIEYVSQRGLREIKGQMRAEGLPLTPAELNRPLPPADRNAAPVYQQLTALLERQPLAGDDKILDGGTKELPPSAAYLAQVRRALLHRQDAVSLIHKAADKPECVFQRDYALGPDLLFPEYKDMRTGVRVLSNESLVLLADGKTPEAIANEALGYRMAQQVAGDPILISKLVGIALNAITDKFMERVLYTAGDQPGIANLVQQTASANWKPVSAPDGMRGEIVLNEVICEMLREGRVADEKDVRTFNTNRTTFRHVPPWSKALIDANELEMLRYMRKQQSVMALPYRISKTRMEALEQESTSHRYWPTNMLATILKPMFGQVTVKQSQGEAQAAVLRVAAGAFAYKQQHGVFPDLIDRAASPVPADPSDGQSLKYRREGNGFVVYSVGKTGRFDGGAADRKPDSYESVFRYPMPAYYTQPASPSHVASTPTP